MSDALGTTPWYLRLLRDESAAAERLAARARLQPLRHRPAAARAGGRTAARRRRGARPRPAAALVAEMLARGRSPRRPGRRDRGRARRYAGASCSGSRAPTCSGCSTSTASVRRSSDVTAATLRRPGWRSPYARDRDASGGSPLPDPGARRRRWAGSAGTSSATAATPTCCSCTTRCPGAEEREAQDAAHAVAEELRRLLALPDARPAAASSTPTSGPRDATGRSCARSPRTPPTTRAGRSCGRRRPCCGPSPVAGDPDLAVAFRRADRPDPLAGGRAGRGRRPRDPPDQGARRGRAAAARRRRDPAHQARPRRARPTSSGRSSCSSSGTARPMPACGRRGRWTRSTLP